MSQAPLSATQTLVQGTAQEAPPNPGGFHFLSPSSCTLPLQGAWGVGLKFLQGLLPECRAHFPG